jgi:threonine/homoserine/homoserine lactone efflux protein
MEAFVAFCGIVGAITVGAVSPGPSFVFVARTAIAISRRSGLAASLGMGIGGVVFAALAVAGLQAVVAGVPWLYAALRLLGGLYLLYLALRLWQGADAAVPLAPEGAAAPAHARRAFALGLATQLSNPKTAIVYASIFAALLPPNPPLWLSVALPAAVFVIEAGWYATVAAAFSSPRPRAAYLRAKRWIDRLASAVMAALGLRLMFDAVDPTVGATPAWLASQP